VITTFSSLAGFTTSGCGCAEGYHPNSVYYLLSYFKFKNDFILAKYPDQNIALLAVAKKTHRRFIDSSLPILVNLAINSTISKVDNWSLYGADWRRYLIKEVVTNTLTAIGTIDFSIIEFSLIRLSANEDFDVRMITAVTLGNLRSKMKEDWYNLIDKWQNSPEIESFISTQIKNVNNNDEDENNNAPKDYILATIGMALGTVAQKDSPNKLDPRVLELFKRMVRLRNRLIIKSVQHTLRLICARHALQISNDLWNDYLIYSIFIDTIAAGLADGYNNLNPSATRSVLFHWLDEIEANPSPRKNYSELLHEDKILCAVIRTLELIDYQSAPKGNQISVEEAYKILEFLRQRCHQPRVRAYLFRAIVKLLEEYLRNPNNQAITYISNLDEKERDQLVLAFRRQYLNQRSEQSGGNYLVRIAGRIIPTWEIQIERPKTNVELLLLEWLNHPDKIISQIAAMALLKFGEIEDLENNTIKTYIEEQIQSLSEIDEEAEEEPFYNSSIEADEYTNIFIKISSQIVRQDDLLKLKNISPVIMQSGTISDTQLVVRIVDEVYVLRA
jgi:hypothetical protein